MKKQFQALALIAILSATCSQSQAAEQRHLKSVRQPNGKTLHLYSDIAEPRFIDLTRTKHDNTIDATFGTAGTVFLNLRRFGGGIQERVAGIPTRNVVVHNMRVLPRSHKISIFLGIGADQKENIIIQLNNDGTLDPEFGVGGILFLDDEGPSEEAPDPFA